jgi:phenylpropionate dioxygenase-like ring-hydroxylating dioxygenase large terminal subunit
MSVVKTGERIDQGPLVSELDFSRHPMRLSTDRYVSREFQERERERLWMRVWQVVGRADELASAGDWKEYCIFDQSFLIVRGKDGKLRGFVNACRHRGNVLCEGKGHSARLTCPFHAWSYGLDGRLLAVASASLSGPVDKAEHGLLQVPVETFAGFVFLNPDPNSPPLSEFLGEAAGCLAPYRMEEMVPVGLNARETLDCNWKVVMEAFMEGYHVHAIHPQLVPSMDMSKQRYSFEGDHSVVSFPMGTSDKDDLGPEGQVDGVSGLLQTFPGMETIIPRFLELVGAYRRPGGTLNFPEDVSARTLLQKATREVMTHKGLDVSGLTDNQMSDRHAWLIFPNLFMTIGVGEATAISVVPHPDGDPNKCIWHVVANYQWLPPEQREQQRAPEVEASDGFSFGLALDQDREQMPRQQKGLRNRALKFVDMTWQEVRISYFHSALESHLELPGGTTKSTVHESYLGRSP